MGVKLTLHCDGCDATAPGGTVRREFRSFSGRSYGFGSASNVLHLEVPDGWIDFDRLTYCTYCPKCWSAITEPNDAP